jgi:CelD/BcsL family acetyltransferase involved in cellulose biosynthesis
LSDIFWDLKGATDTPSWRRIRHSAAVRTDLPALELVPWNIREGVVVLVVRVNRSGRFVIVVALTPINGKIKGGISALEIETTI